MTSRPRGPAASTLILVCIWAGAWAMPASAAGRPVTLVSQDGTALVGSFFEAEDRPSPGVVLVHMLHRSRSDWDEIGSRLASAGISALAIDLRGHGGSAGSADSLSEMAGDVRSAVQWLSARPDVRPDAIGVAGGSLGANLALIVAADVPAIRAVAALSPSLDYRGVRVGLDVMRRIGDRPVWLASSTEDPYALRTLKDLMEGGSGPREQYLSTSTAHGTKLLTTDGTLATTLVDWLRQRLLS